MNIFNRLPTIAVVALLGIIIVGSVGGIVWWYKPKKLSPSTPNSPTTVLPQPSSNTTDTPSQQPSVAIPGTYETYSPELLSRAKEGTVVLFFYAAWCPTCNGLQDNINNNLQNIPHGVSILKVDYDRQRDLVAKYKVTYQHTLVQVDPNGNQIKKWSGSPTLDRLIKEIQ